MMVAQISADAAQMLFPMNTQAGMAAEATMQRYVVERSASERHVTRLYD